MKRVISALCVMLIMALATPVQADAQFKKFLKDLGKELLTAPATTDGSSTTTTSKRSRDNGRLKVTMGDDYPDISMKVKSCTAVGDDVIIVFTVTNNGEKESNVRFEGTDTFDDEGNNYKKVGYSAGNGNGTEDRYVVNLPTDVPVKVKMRIKGVAEEASILKVVKIGSGTYGYFLFATIRNVPINREAEEMDDDDE